MVGVGGAVGTIGATRAPRSASLACVGGEGRVLHTRTHVPKPGGGRSVLHIAAFGQSSHAECDSSLHPFGKKKRARRKKKSMSTMGRKKAAPKPVIVDEQDRLETSWSHYTRGGLMEATVEAPESKKKKKKARSKSAKRSFGSVFSKKEAPAPKKTIHLFGPNGPPNPPSVVPFVFTNRPGSAGTRPVPGVEGRLGLSLSRHRSASQLTTKPPSSYGAIPQQTSQQQQHITAGKPPLYREAGTSANGSAGAPQDETENQAPAGNGAYSSNLRSNPELLDTQDPATFRAEHFSIPVSKIRPALVGSKRPQSAAARLRSAGPAALVGNASAHVFRTEMWSEVERCRLKLRAKGLGHDVITTKQLEQCMVPHDVDMTTEERANLGFPYPMTLLASNPYWQKVVQKKAGKKRRKLKKWKFKKKKSENAKSEGRISLANLKKLQKILGKPVEEALMEVKAASTPRNVAPSKSASPARPPSLRARLASVSKNIPAVETEVADSRTDYFARFLASLQPQSVDQVFPLCCWDGLALGSRIPLKPVALPAPTAQERETSAEDLAAQREVTRQRLLAEQREANASKIRERIREVLEKRWTLIQSVFHYYSVDVKVPVADSGEEAKVEMPPESAASPENPSFGISVEVKTVPKVDEPTTTRTTTHRMMSALHWVQFARNCDIWDSVCTNRVLLDLFFAVVTGAFTKQEEKLASGIQKPPEIKNATDVTHLIPVLSDSEQKSNVLYFFDSENLCSLGMFVELLVRVAWVKMAKRPQYVQGTCDKWFDDLVGQFVATLALKPRSLTSSLRLRILTQEVFDVLVYYHDYLSATYLRFASEEDDFKHTTSGQGVAIPSPPAHDDPTKTRTWLLSKREFRKLLQEFPVAAYENVQLDVVLVNAGMQRAGTNRRNIELQYAEFLECFARVADSNYEQVDTSHRSEEFPLSMRLTRLCDAVWPSEFGEDARNLHGWG